MADDTARRGAASSARRVALLANRHSRVQHDIVEMLSTVPTNWRHETHTATTHEYSRDTFKFACNKNTTARNRNIHERGESERERGKTR